MKLVLMKLVLVKTGNGEMFKCFLLFNYSFLVICYLFFHFKSVTVPKVAAEGNLT